MASSFTQIFIYLLIMQVFYSFAVSVFIPAIPDSHQQQVVAYTTQGVMEFNTLANAVEGAVDEQYNVPFLDYGALIFYSTSIVLNLIINFVTAVPQMLSVLLNILFAFMPLSETIQIQTTIIFIGLATVLYYILLIMYILGQRTTTGGGFG